jgi:hypothetical protein
MTSKDTHRPGKIDTRRSPVTLNLFQAPARRHVRTSDVGRAPVLDPRRRGAILEEIQGLPAIEERARCNDGRPQHGSTLDAETSSA